MEFFGLNFTKTSKKDLLNKLFEGKELSVFTPNPEIILETNKDKQFKKNLASASVLTVDWIGLYLGFQIEDCRNKFLSILLLPYFFFNLIFRKGFLEKKYTQRITWSELTKDILERLNKEGGKATLIDLYNPSDHKKVESQRILPWKMAELFPNIEFQHIIFEGEEGVSKEIQEFWPDFLFSSLWMKKQEDVILRFLKGSWAKAGLWIWSSFDYFLGYQKRAPEFMKKSGLEWLYRLFTAPNKHKRIVRIFKAVVVFPLAAVKRK